MIDNNAISTRCYVVPELYLKIRMVCWKINFVFRNMTNNLRYVIMAYIVGGRHFKGMLRQNIEHFLKKRKYEKVGFSEMN